MTNLWIYVLCDFLWGFIRLICLASIASSKKEEAQFKTIQLNSREPTRNIVTTRKNVVQPVATIEAVPLDLVVEIKTPNQGLRKQNNVNNVHSHSAKHQNNPGNLFILGIKN